MAMSLRIRRKCDGKTLKKQFYRRKVTEVNPNSCQNAIDV